MYFKSVVCWWCVIINKNIRFCWCVSPERKDLLLLYKFVFNDIPPSDCFCSHFTFKIIIFLNIYNETLNCGADIYFLRILPYIIDILYALWLISIILFSTNGGKRGNSRLELKLDLVVTYSSSLSNSRCFPCLFFFLI